MTSLPSPRREKIVGVSCILGTLIGWASILLFLKHLAPYLDSWTTNGWRYGLSALIWLPLLLSNASRGLLPRGIWWRGLVPAVFNTVGQVLYAQMPYYIGPALGGFLIRMALVSSTLGAFILFADERVLLRSGLYWTGICSVLGGSIGTVFLGNAPVHGATATGILLGTTSGLMFGLYGVAVRRCMQGISAMTSFSVISLYTAAGLVTIMVFHGRAHGLEVFKLSAFNWFMLVASAIIGIAICHVSYYAAIARLGVAVSAAVVQLSPFLCAIGAYIIYGEVLAQGQWLSGFLMIGGAMALLMAEQRRPRPAPARGFPVVPENLGDPISVAAEPVDVVQRFGSR